MSTWVEVATVDSFRPNSCRTVETRGHRIAVVRVGDVFHAVDDACPHRGAPLGAGYVDGVRLFCPLHGWEFNSATGACVTRPDQALRTYPVDLRGDRVFVELPSGT